MLVSDVRTELLYSQMKISDTQGHIRNASSELLHTQTTIKDGQASIEEEKKQELKNIRQKLDTPRQYIGEVGVQDGGIQYKLHNVYDTLSPVRKWQRLSPNAQAISDARINLEEAQTKLKNVHDSIETAQEKLEDAVEGRSPIRNTEEAEILLQVVQARIGEAKSHLQTALELMRTIPTLGQLTVGLLLGIALAAFGWYELFLRAHFSRFDWGQFIILCIALLASCWSAAYLAEVVQRVQRSRQKYIAWLCNIIFLALTGFALFYGILHQLGYQDKPPSLPEFVIFTFLIVIAPLVTFVISYGHKHVSKQQTA